jgi:Permuted papain-like amidase enzyme, YaeF/YiiX, C92 family
MRSLRESLTHRVIDAVTRPRRSYQHFTVNDSQALKKKIEKADIILVDGDQRVSQAIKYLTQSTWSHSVIYVGDELVARDHPLRSRLLHRYGREARHMIIEALVGQGVIVAPLVKYIDFNIRICRPRGLREDDRRSILGFAVAQIGREYDMRNFIDLARYLFPFHLVPPSLRDEALHFGSREPTEVICSSFLAEAFRRVGFPILPVVVRPRRGKTVGERFFETILGRPTRRAYSGLFRARHPTLAVPRDFDLSPYFDIIKFNAIEEGAFDYRKMVWEEAP